MSKSEVRIRLSLGPDYEKMPPEDKYTVVSFMLNDLSKPKSVREALLGELRRVETELGWPHKRYNGG